MKYLKKGPALPLMLIAISALVILLAFFIYKNTSQKKVSQENKNTEKSLGLDTTNWKTYTNQKYNLELKFPDNLSFVESGPNESQKQLSQRVQTSGTITPSLETVTFSNINKDQEFQLGIFESNKTISSENDFDNSYLYLYGPCDIRWGFVPNIKSMESYSNFKTLKVTGNNKGFMSCYYLVNQKLILVFSTKAFKNQSDFEKVDNYIPQIVSSLKFTDSGSNSNTDSSGKFCGGIAGIGCPKGYFCQLDGNYPDSGGTCIKNNNNHQVYF